MNKLFQITLAVLMTVVLFACGGGGDELTEKKAELEALRSQYFDLKAQIATLETEINEIDPEYNKANTILISTLALEKSSFEHKVEVRGAVASRKNIVISAETMGRIEKINVAEGQNLSKGTLLMKLDADILENNIAEVETQLELAEAVFVRQKNLWDQNIGTEIQYLQTKNNKESLERRLATLKSQLKQSYVRSPFAGVADEIPVREGEMAQPGMPLARIVNQREMYIKADVSEAFLGKFQKGDQAEIYLPTLDMRLVSQVVSVGQVINEDNRTFAVEIALPSDTDLKFRPNQVTILNLTDYFQEEAVSIPTRLVQADDQGNFVYGLKTEDGRKLASKIRINPGKSFNSKTEVLSGLKGNETLIDNGYREVNEGVEVSVATASL
ncbi:MAG: efflux RND transporter periplasmic adaptor subunit [Cytophagales bacterium]|nr:efflux RND transporter periplasmic adaptor subunit [Cytophagales bacterium]